MLTYLKQLNTLMIDMINRNENILHHSTNDKKAYFYNNKTAVKRDKFCNTVL